MAQKELATNTQLDSINAHHVAQLFDDMVAMDEIDDDRKEARLESIAEELRIEFDNERQVEFAFLMMAEAHRL